MLAIYDLDMRFTFIVVGWSGSVHGMRVFNDVLHKYSTIFHHPLQGMIICAHVFFILKTLFLNFMLEIKM